MIANANTPKKKIWSKPEIHLLDTTNVNGGGGVGYKEGAPNGYGGYSLRTNGGGFYGKNFPQGIWDNYHS